MKTKIGEKLMKMNVEMRSYDCLTMKGVKGVEFELRFHKSVVLLFEVVCLGWEVG